MTSAVQLHPDTKCFIPYLYSVKGLFKLLVKAVTKRVSLNILGHFKQETTKIYSLVGNIKMIL